MGSIVPDRAGVNRFARSRGPWNFFYNFPCHGGRVGRSYPAYQIMAKTAWREREKRKRKTVDKYAELRAELKKKGDYLALSQLPRNASPVRLSNRCRVSGRKRAFLREFQMSRLTFRELACAGLIPGVTKASW